MLDRAASRTQQMRVRLPSLDSKEELAEPIENARRNTRPHTLGRASPSHGRGNRGACECNAHPGRDPHAKLTAERAASEVAG